MNNYRALDVCEREKIKLKLYRIFEKNYSKKLKKISKQKKEYLRCSYINKNFYNEEIKYRKSKQWKIGPRSIDQQIFKK